MLKTLEATGFIRMASNGQTKPMFISAEDSDGETYDVVCKTSFGCGNSVTRLAREVFGACVGAELGLPIPEPVLVSVSNEYINSVADAEAAMLFRSSSAVAFGSIHLPEFSAWSPSTLVRTTLLPIAASTFVFDCITQNADRRIQNPNCLVRGEAVRLIDHELTFMINGILLWKAPWLPTSLEWMKSADEHIFFKALQKATIDFAPIKQAWQSLSDERLDEFIRAIPEQWSDCMPEMQEALMLVKGARDNFDGCITEIERILQ